MEQMPPNATEIVLVTEDGRIVGRGAIGEPIPVEPAPIAISWKIAAAAVEHDAPTAKPRN